MVHFLFCTATSCRLRALHLHIRSVLEQWFYCLSDWPRIGTNDVCGGHHACSFSSRPAASLDEGESSHAHEEEDQKRHRSQSLAAADTIQGRRQSEWVVLFNCHRDIALVDNPMLSCYEQGTVKYEFRLKACGSRFLIGNQTAFLFRNIHSKRIQIAFKMSRVSIFRRCGGQCGRGCHRTVGRGHMSNVREAASQLKLRFQSPTLYQDLHLRVSWFKSLHRENIVNS